MSERLNFMVRYSMDPKVQPVIWSDIKREYWSEVLADYFASVMGSGVDNTPRAERDVYRIHLQLDLDDDTFYNQHDCGNKALREGLLMDVLKQVEAGTVEVADKPF